MLMRLNRDDAIPSIDDLITQHYAAIYRLACSLLDDSAEAEDATQEIFVAAHNNLHRYRGDASAKTWLFTIGVNACRKRLRRRKARQIFNIERVETVSTHCELVESAETEQPEPTTIRNEMEAELWAAIDQLKPKHRFPLILRYVHDMTAAEIAEVLEIKEGTVYSRIHYAQRQLKGILTANSVVRVP